MNAFQADHSMYLVTPKGFEDRCMVVIAISKTDAIAKANAVPNIQEAQSLYGAELSVIDLTERFKKNGYQIYIAREGCYH